MIAAVDGAIKKGFAVQMESPVTHPLPHIPARPPAWAAVAGRVIDDMALASLRSTRVGLGGLFALNMILKEASMSPYAESGRITRVTRGGFDTTIGLWATEGGTVLYVLRGSAVITVLAVEDEI